MSGHYTVNFAPLLTHMIAAGQIDHVGTFPPRARPSVKTAMRALDEVSRELNALRDALNQYLAEPSPTVLIEVTKELTDVLYRTGQAAIALDLPIGDAFASAHGSEPYLTPCECRSAPVVGCPRCHFTGQRLDLERVTEDTQHDLKGVLTKHRRITA